MGFLLKAFLFGLVIYYVLKSIGHVFARIVGGTPVPKQRDTRYQQRRDGEINVDYAPEKEGATRKKNKSEGTYIDYEEIK